VILNKATAYSVEKASCITGVLPSTIRYWAGPRSQLIEAEVADSRLQGSRKLFSLKNLVQIRVASLLSTCGLPQDTIRTELPRILKRRLPWFDPAQEVWGPVALILVADRNAWRGKPWVITGVGGAVKADGPYPGFVSSLSTSLGDFETATLTWPKGWVARTDHDRQTLRELNGVKRLSIVNLAEVKKYIMERLGQYS
jgi:hypothetical protein